MKRHKGQQRGTSWVILLSSGITYQSTDTCVCAERRGKQRLPLLHHKRLPARVTPCLSFFFWPSFIPLQLHLQNSSHPVRGQKWTEVDSSSSLRQLQQRTCTSLLTSVLFRGISMQHRPPAAPRHQDTTTTPPQEPDKQLRSPRCDHGLVARITARQAAAVVVPALRQSSSCCRGNFRAAHWLSSRAHRHPFGSRLCVWPCR